MTRKELLDRITVDPNVCFGKPTIRGTRIWVALVVELLSDGETIDQILAGYPQLRREDVLASLAYAAELTRERIIPLDVEVLR